MREREAETEINELSLDAPIMDQARSQMKEKLTIDPKPLTRGNVLYRNHSIFFKNNSKTAAKDTRHGIFAIIR